MNTMNASIHHPWYHAAARPDHPAVVMLDTGESISYGGLVAGTNRWAHWLAGQGLQAGDTVAVFMQNTLRYAELLWGAKACGLHYVCVGSRLQVDEVEHVLRDSGAKVLVTTPDCLAVAQAAARRLPSLQGLVTGDAVGTFASYEAAVAGCPETPLEGRPRGNSMLYSSGTTGRPKGVRTPIGSAPATEPPLRFAAMSQQFQLDEKTVHLCAGPLYHVASQRFMMTVHRAGGTVLVMDRFDAAQLLADIARHRATHAMLVPTMFVRLLRLPDAVRAAADLASMRCCVHGAAPCAPSVKRAMLDWWGPVIYEAYGGTEGIGNTFIGPAEWLTHPGSVGRASPGCEIEIVDEGGRACPPGVTGLVYLRNGRRFEYHHDPQKTSAASREGGWATFGDIGHLDAEGYLYLTDRQSDVIISGGVNIYPKEAENVLAAHPAVAEVAVIGVPDEEFGESVHAVVEPAAAVADEPALTHELIAWCRSRLAGYKCPKTFSYVATLPRSDTGKVLKRVLKAGHPTAC